MISALPVRGYPRSIVLELFERAKVKGDDYRTATHKVYKAVDTPERASRLQASYYFLFLGACGPILDARKAWLAMLDEALHDAAVRMSH